VGCGGGILAEAMAVKGATVTGIDLADKSLAVAQLHLLESGAQVTYEKISTEEISADLSWRQGKLIFRGEPLAEALQVVSRHTAIEFEYANPDIRNKRLAGVFKSGDAEGLLNTLSRNFNLRHTYISQYKIRLEETAQ
jgi:transmembrane sensor